MGGLDGLDGRRHLALRFLLLLLLFRHCFVHCRVLGCTHFRGLVLVVRGRRGCFRDGGGGGGGRRRRCEMAAELGWARKGCCSRGCREHTDAS